MLLPLAEIAMRRLVDTGIPGAAPFTLNLTLWVGLLGAAIAAREGKLLTLATGEFLPKAHRWRRARRRRLRRAGHRDDVRGGRTRAGRHRARGRR